MSNPGVSEQITFYKTKNLARIHKFYTEILKFPLILDQGKCRIYQACNCGYIGFCNQRGMKNEISEIIFTIVTSKVEEWFTYLTKNGVVIPKKPERNPQFNIYHFFFRDPDGNLIEIQEFLDPRWDQIS
jgi:catechol 2,3-dioxygenase-like lactoylglutathione lyase family enzyme